MTPSQKKLKELKDLKKQIKMIGSLFTCPCCDNRCTNDPSEYILEQVYLKLYELTTGESLEVTSINSLH